MPEEERCDTWMPWVEKGCENGRYVAREVPMLYTSIYAILGFVAM